MAYFSLCLGLCLCSNLFILFWNGLSSLALGNDTDKLSLLSFKDSITQDPHGVMSSWNDSTHFCEWFGVTCRPRHQRVVALNLEDYDLVGTISPSVGNLSFLTVFNLSSNNLNGKIPQEFGRLSRLQHLNLSFNYLGGEIPLNLSNCINLKYLLLSYNSLTGNIPFQLNSLQKLIYLNLSVNNLTGTIPPWIGNYSSLLILSIERNNLHGIIPKELGQLSHLQFFQVSQNILSGVIPSSLYNITSIYQFDVIENRLHGTIPPNVGETLPNLQVFSVGGNGFHGEIPHSLSNASKLQKLRFPKNYFTGSVPNNLGSLTSLIWLSLGYNKLVGDLDFITSLSNCSILQVLGLNDNRLVGHLPQSIGNLSAHLQSLAFGSNLISGSLPTSIENLVGLTALGVDDNLLSGSIPVGVGKLRELRYVTLDQNKLTGQIPSSLGNLTLLIYLQMGTNRLEGSIPTSLENLTELLELNISSNKLRGAVPKQVFSLSNLILLLINNNSLSGSLPMEVGTFVNLQLLDVSDNELSGKIPNTLGSCMKLEELFMSGNLFHGPIPQSFKALRQIQVLNLSHNNLFGEIPEFLANVTFLESLDLSYNDFNGEVPKEGIFLNASEISVSGNKKLCGGIKELYLPFCEEQKIERSGRFLSRKMIFIICFGALPFILVAIWYSFYWLRTSRKETATSGATTSSALEKWKSGASYLDIFNSTNGFSSECLLGTGSFGSVYKGVLSDEETFVAIKVLNLQQRGVSKSFMAECEALKNIRHRNLIKVVTVCSSTDFEGNEFKALIFEFMPNGSLGQWLHPNTGGDRLKSRSLSFIERLRIAIDVAFGLEYLHHSYEETIVHCDIKPNNILLDVDMTAHVADFGLARFLIDSDDDQQEISTLSSGLKGTIGYIPPEYGTGGRASALGDMYSYGILLLEMFTGLRPTDEMLKDGLSLYDFVSMALPDRVLEIADASLLSDIQEEEEDGGNGEPGNVNESEEAPALIKRTMEWKTGECLVSVFTIALSCCAPSSKDRAVVSDIVNKLIALRDLICDTP